LLVFCREKTRVLDILDIEILVSNGLKGPELIFKATCYEDGAAAAAAASAAFVDRG
jgi:hypothetical protein